MKAIPFLFLLIPVLCCCTGKRANQPVKADQYENMPITVVSDLPEEGNSLKIQKSEDSYNQLSDSVWYFLTKSGDSYVIEESEETPVMKIYIARNPASLNVSYGQEGFYFHIAGRRSVEGGFGFLCIDPSEEGDTLLVTAEFISPELVVWKVPNPYTETETFEIIPTVPGSRSESVPVVRIDNY